jgi:peroxiredoxin
MKSLLAAISLTAVALGAASAHANAVVGQPAPAFTLADTNGKQVSLADYKGKIVVLEWTNPGCPFVMKHYRSGNMPALQKKYAKDVVWLAVNSTSAEHSDHMTGAKLNAFMQQYQSAPARYLLDVDGKVGRAYGARTTPHMYIVDAGGKLAYVGAIDDIASASEADVKTAKNFVAAAIEEIKAGKAVSNASTSPYGCSVKYKN